MSRLKSTIFITMIAILVATNLHADQTIGLFVLDSASSEGYTLLRGMNSNSAYLIDKYGREVHSWSDTTYSFWGYPYLLENGHLVRMVTPVAGKIHVVEYNWDGSKYWDFVLTDPDYSQHHDIAPLPNGNIIILSRHFQTKVEFSNEGRDTSGVFGGEFYVPERLYEVKRTGSQSATIVWEWTIMDHLIQDFDQTKNNFGVVENHPELMDINYGGDSPDWLHANGVNYNPLLDQIILSFRHISEIWVIDHSTTTSEAKGHSGGLQNMGGDILYRWGNPEAYRAGDLSDKQLSWQHNAQWIEPGYPGEGNIIVFSNGNDWGYSTIVEITPPNNISGAYPSVSSGTAFDPPAPEWTYNDNPPEAFYSNFISGCQRLKNGNTLFCIGTEGTFKEVNPVGEVVWLFVNPIGRFGPAVQGELNPGNLCFRVNRYSPDYGAFVGRDLSPTSAIGIYPVKISGTNSFPETPTEADNNITITTKLLSDIPIFSATAMVDTGDGYFPVQLIDDGAHFDKIAGDLVYGAIIGSLAPNTKVSYYIEIENDTSAITYDPPNPPATVYSFKVAYECGNIDGVFSAGNATSITDLTYLVSYLFKSGPPPPSFDAANVDGNGSAGNLVNISDLTFLVSFLFKGGPPPIC